MTTDSADRAEWLKQPEAEARRGRQTTKSGRKQKRAGAARRPRAAEQLRTTAQPAPKQAGFFDLIRYILERWFK